MENKLYQMEIYIKAISSKQNLMEKELINGNQVKFIKVNL